MNPPMRVGNDVIFWDGRGRPLTRWERLRLFFGLRVVPSPEGAYFDPVNPTWPRGVKRIEVM